MAEDLDLEYLAELERNAKEEIDAHREWLIENPDEQDGGAEEIPVHPDVLLSLIAAARSAVSAERPGLDEPVAWRYRTQRSDGQWSMWTVASEDPTEDGWSGGFEVRKLYEHPAPVKADIAGEDPFASLPRFMDAVPATPEGPKGEDSPQGLGQDQCGSRDDLTANATAPLAKGDDVPAGYRALPDGVRCRCIKLWRGASGQHYCCRSLTKDKTNAG